MKIIISTDSIKFPVTGIGRYALELINNLAVHPDITSIKYLSGLKVVSEPPVLVNTHSVSAGDLKKHLRNSRIVSDIYRLTVPVLKGRALKPFSEYVFHSPNYYIPPGHKKACTTFHDLSIFHYPEYHPKGRVHLMKKELLSSVSRAQVLITDSRFTKNEVANFFDFAPDRIIVAPLASSGDFFPREESECKSVLAQYGLNYGMFTFFAGTIEPRKNLKNLLLAYQNLPIDISLHFPLVISGYQGWESEELHRLLDVGSQRGWVKYLGYTDQKTLSILFSASRAFLFPSRYEGFGLPVLEAMAAGTPVITSNVSSLPEVAGDAGLIVDPDDVDQLTKYIHEILINDSLYAELTARGFLQNAKFSWRQCALETIKAYKLVDSLE